MIGGTGIDVDDRAANRDFAACLDLVFTAIPHRDELFDQFVALVNPAPAGAINGNVAFADDTTPVSSNLDLRVCESCALGTADLGGTGFETYGATGWLRATPTSVT